MIGPRTSSDSTRNAGRRTLASTRAEPELLAHVGLFADLSPDELVSLARRLASSDPELERRVAKGRALYQQPHSTSQLIATLAEGKRPTHAESDCPSGEEAE